MIRKAEAVPVPQQLPGVHTILRRRWWVAVGVVVGLLTGIALGQLRTPVYESTTYLSVTSTVVEDPGSLARGAQALARLATSPSIVSPELQHAGLADAAAN